jgi:hypothetical protein
MNRIALVPALLTLTLTAASCGGGGSSREISPSPSIAVSISPSSISVPINGSQTFTASVSNDPGNRGVMSWTLTGTSTTDFPPCHDTFCGTLTTMSPTTVHYTAPTNLGLFSPTVRLSAVSAADPRKSGTASITILATTSNGSSFRPAGNMRTARSGHTATLLMNGKVLVAGGGNATAELFDPANASFTPTGSMSTSRYGATATLLANGNVLIAGGFGPGASELPRLKTAELYDPLTGTFSPTGSMALPRVLHAATLLDDGKVLITGGTIDNVGGGVATATSEVYDPSTGAFTTVGNMITDRAQHSATLLADGQVLVVGGWNGHRADAADDPPWDPLFAELYDPASGSFTATGSMSTTRVGHSAIRLANGKVIILGGIPNPQNLHQPVNPRYAELYDPTTNAFSPVGNLTLSQTGYSATLLTNGRILLAGGEDQGRAVGTAELLDPNSGSLTATGGLVTERKGHTATLLLDGRVLVTGGVDSNGNTLASAEVYK